MRVLDGGLTFDRKTQLLVAEGCAFLKRDAVGAAERIWRDITMYARGAAAGSSHRKIQPPAAIDGAFESKVADIELVGRVFHECVPRQHMRGAAGYQSPRRWQGVNVWEPSRRSPVEVGTRRCGDIVSSKR